MESQIAHEAGTKPEAQVKSKAVYTAKDLINAGVGSRNHIYKMLKDGSIPSTQLGDKYLIKPEWVRANTTL
jgi:hypothetical protein